METKRTAVEYIERQLILKFILFRLPINDQMELMRSIRYARLMHKEQIKYAYEIGDLNGTATESGHRSISSEEYYNETYGK